MPTQNVSMTDWVYSRIREQQMELGASTSFSKALETLVKVADAHLAYLETGMEVHAEEGGE